MDWMTTFLVVASLAVIYMLIKRSGQIPQKDATEYLRNGATVIDVRTPGEFNSGHLSQAVNMPLDELDMLIPSTVRNKDQVLLLHCQTGMRSGMAAKRLVELGYKSAFNLGSYH